jgi:hypothetical protein
VARSTWLVSQGLLQELFAIPSAESTRDGGQLTEAELLGRPDAAAVLSKPHNRMKMVELLDVLDAFVVPAFSGLKQSSLKVFRGVDLEQCRAPSPSSGRRVIDLVYVHRVLQDMRARAPRGQFGGPDDSAAAEAEEMRLIMTSALHQNQHEEAIQAKMHVRAFIFSPFFFFLFLLK